METVPEPLRGMEIVRKLVAVKKQVQREAVENYRNNPEIQVIYEQLNEQNTRTRDGDRTK